MAKTNISWTDATWNPTTGCDRVSPGCDNCYALAMAGRLKAMDVEAYQNDGGPRSGPGFAFTEHFDRLDQPARWQKPRMIFVNSMSDLFHEQMEPAFLGMVFDMMMSHPRHVFQVLTKRHRRMHGLIRPAYEKRSGLSRYWRNARSHRHIWLGVSVEDQQWAEARIPWLLRTPAAVRWLSVEPMLGPVNLSEWIDDIDWVVCGGESGADRRPFDKDWARSIRDQCQAAGVPFFLKQGGAFRPGQDRELDGRTWEEFPT